MSENAKSQAENLAEIKRELIAAAGLATGSMPMLIEKLVVLAATSDDPEVIRRTLETLHKVGVSVEPKQTSVIFAPLNFSLVLDDSPQIAPGKKVIPVQNAEDAVLVLPAVEPTLEIPAPAAPVPIKAPEQAFSLFSIDDE